MSLDRMQRRLERRIARHAPPPHVLEKLRDSRVVAALAMVGAVVGGGGLLYVSNRHAGFVKETEAWAAQRRAAIDAAAAKKMAALKAAQAKDEAAEAEKKRLAAEAAVEAEKAKKQQDLKDEHSAIIAVYRHLVLFFQSLALIAGSTAIISMAATAVVGPEDTRAKNARAANQKLYDLGAIKVLAVALIAASSVYSHLQFIGVDASSIYVPHETLRVVATWSMIGLVFLGALIGFGMKGDVRTVGLLVYAVLTGWIMGFLMFSIGASTLVAQGLGVGDGVMLQTALMSVVVLVVTFGVLSFAPPGWNIIPFFGLGAFTASAALMRAGVDQGLAVLLGMAVSAVGVYMYMPAGAIEGDDIVKKLKGAVQQGTEKVDQGKMAVMVVVSYMVAQMLAMMLKLAPMLAAGVALLL